MKEKIKKILNFFWKEFIYGGHLQCLGVVSLLVIEGKVLDLKISWRLLVFVYLIFYLIYIYNRIKEIEIDELTNPQRVKHFKSYLSKINKIFYGLSLGVILGLVLLKKFSFLIFGLSLLVLGLLYTPTLKNLTKKLVGFKNFYVALFFSAILASPFFWDLNLVENISQRKWFGGGGLFFLVFLKGVLMQAFLDCKDVEGDEKIGLKTFPVVYGREKIFKFLKIFNSFVFGGLLFCFCVWFKIFPLYFLGLLLIIPFNFFSIKLAEERKYLGYILESGEFFWWLILIFLSEKIL